MVYVCEQFRTPALNVHSGFSEPDKVESLVNDIRFPLLNSCTDPGLNLSPFFVMFVNTILVLCVSI